MVHNCSQCGASVGTITEAYLCPKTRQAALRHGRKGERTPPPASDPFRLDRSTRAKKRRRHKSPATDWLGDDPFFVA